MKTSPTTSDAAFRAALLDVLHAQWCAFGVPIEASLDSQTLEVIDPESLLWVSLEFFLTDARLAEGVRSWVSANRTKINRQRLNRLARHGEKDPRSDRWHALERGVGLRNEGLGAKPVGQRSLGPSTLLLRSRDVLGNDCRSFLIVQLIGSPRGVRLRDVARATGYSYRSISEAASGWERAGVVRIQHGHCVLGDPTSWCRLLGCDAAEVTVIDWSAIYGAAVELLRTLAHARELAFAPDHSLVASVTARTIAAFEIAAGGIDRARTPALEHLRRAIVK